MQVESIHFMDSKFWISRGVPKPLDQRVLGVLMKKILWFKRKKNIASISHIFKSLCSTRIKKMLIRGKKIIRLEDPFKKYFVKLLHTWYEYDVYVLMRHIMEDFKLPPFRINGNFAYFFDVIKHSIDRDMHLNWSSLKSCQ